MDQLTNHEERTPHENITDQIRAYLLTGDQERLAELLESLPSGEVHRAISDLSEGEQSEVLHLLGPEEAADLIDDLPDAQAAAMLDDIEPSRAAAIVEELQSDDRADVLAEMEDEDAEAILDALPAEEASETRELLTYPTDTAGGVMMKEFIAFPGDAPVQQVIDDLRNHAEEYKHYDVQYFYVVDSEGVLDGVLRLRDMVLSPPNRPIREIMIPNPTSVRDDVPIDRLQQMFEIHSYVAIPVVNARGQLIGVVTEKDAAEAMRKRASRTMLRLAGIFSGEELRSMPLKDRVQRRLSWLTLNVFLNLAAASVISVYQHTLTQLIALAIFLPIVSDMSGASGSQAVAISLRELTMGVVRPRDIFYVLRNELKLGIITGLFLGVLLGLIGYYWQDNAVLGVVVAIALAINTVLAVIVGGSLPLILKAFKLDPAIASIPILTTITDMFGFFLVLSLASIFLTIWV